MRVLIKDTKFCDVFETVDVYYEIRNGIEGIHLVPALFRAGLQRLAGTGRLAGMGI